MKTMKYILRRFFAISVAMTVAGVALTGCINDDLFTPSMPAYAAGDSSLQLFISRVGEPTRAAYNGNDFTKAEKYVKSVDLFFYSSDAVDNTAASHYVRTVPAMNEGEASNTGMLNVSIPKEVLEGLFGEEPTGEHDFKVYAAVNCEETLDKEGLTLGALKSTMAVSESFVNQTLTDENGDLSDFDGFVMFTAAGGGDVVTFDADNNVINGTVTVNKLTSKIDLYVGFGAEGGSAVDFTVKDAEGKDWKVYNYQEVKDDDVFGESVEAFIVNGVKKVRIGGAYNVDTFLGSGADGYLTNNDYFDLWYYDEGSGDDGDEASHMNYAQGFKRSVSDDKATYPYVIQAPFYTYPNEWTTDVLEQHRTYLILKVNWIPTENANVETDLLETYYKIPLNVSTNNIKSNQYYRVKVKVNTLGGEHFGEPVELTDCSYEILDWGAEDFNAKLRDTRYLEVRQTMIDTDGTTYTGLMKNINQIVIPFESSHKVEIKSVEITYIDFTGNDNNGKDDQDAVIYRAGKTTSDISITPTKFTKSYEEMTDNKWQCAYIDDINQRLYVQHFIGHSNDAGDHYSYSTGTASVPDLYIYTPYFITIKLHHADNGFEEKIRTVTIKHYPGIYIDGGVNESFNLEKKNGAGGTTDQLHDMWNPLAHMYFFGFVRINDITRSNKNGLLGGGPGMYNDLRASPFGGLQGMNKAGITFNASESPIMYVITTTQLGEEWNKYHIADPRSNYNNIDLAGDVVLDIEDINVATSWTPVDARHIDKNPTGHTGHRLTYYYPTKEGTTDQEMWTLSPKFRVASSMGAQRNGNEISHEEARKRCASYTEFGYPAGRWRLPTLGEIQFMIALSRKDIIPDLFSDRSNVKYIAAQGVYSFADPDNPLIDNGKGYVRCVYDDWYWDNHLSTLNEMYNDGYVFIWGDRERNNPQDQPFE